jgi:hypothetical protein
MGRDRSRGSPEHARSSRCAVVVSVVARTLALTDTVFYRNPHYHRAEDTPDKLAYPQFARVTEGLLLSLAVLARQGFDLA